MRAIRRSNTRPELAIRSELHRRGRRFRKDAVVRLGGRTVRPDIVFTRWHVAVFVDGCFWHVCPEHGSAPRTNQSYWGPKLRRTVERDREADAALKDADWAVVRIWEHEQVHDAVSLVEQVIEDRRNALRLQ